VCNPPKCRRAKRQTARPCRTVRRIDRRASNAHILHHDAPHKGLGEANDGSNPLNRNVQRQRACARRRETTITNGFSHCINTGVNRRRSDRDGRTLGHVIEWRRSRLARGAEDNAKNNCSVKRRKHLVCGGRGFEAPSACSKSTLVQMGALWSLRRRPQVREKNRQFVGSAALAVMCAFDQLLNRFRRNDGRLVPIKESGL
jgi:hypothetical protein